MAVQLQNGHSGAMQPSGRDPQGRSEHRERFVYIGPKRSLRKAYAGRQRICRAPQPSCSTRSTLNHEEVVPSETSGVESELRQKDSGSVVASSTVSPGLVDKELAEPSTCSVPMAVAPIGRRAWDCPLSRSEIEQRLGISSSSGICTATRSDRQGCKPQQGAGALVSPPSATLEMNIAKTYVVDLLNRLSLDAPSCSWAKLECGTTFCRAPGNLAQTSESRDCLAEEVSVTRQVIISDAAAKASCATESLGHMTHLEHDPCVLPFARKQALFAGKVAVSGRRSL